MSQASLVYLVVVLLGMELRKLISGRVPMLSAVLAACAIPGSSSAVSAQSGGPPLSPADVVILAVPTAPTTVRVAVGYSGVVARDRVNNEVRGLAAAGGWQLGPDVTINTERVQARHPDKFPRTTGAMFTLYSAPQVADASPVLGPYLQAFRRWDHIEVIFGVGDITPYRGVTTLRTPALSVQLVKDPGVYRYEVDIHDHTGSHFDLSQGIRPAISNVDEARPAARSRRAASPLPLILMLVGGLITTGAVAALALFRKPH